MAGRVDVLAVECGEQVSSAAKHDPTISTDGCEHLTEESFDPFKFGQHLAELEVQVDNLLLSNRGDLAWHVS
jgi:hypothetical protein